MRYYEIEPSILNGSINVPPSKSMSHRAVIAACLADGESIVENIVLSKDIIATIDGMKQLGARIDIHNGENHRVRLVIQGIKNHNASGITIACNESGSTLRFLIPIAALSSNETTFVGKGKLVERPLTVYYENFETHNLQYSTQGGQLPLTLKGPLKAGEYKIDGGVSSQFVSGLLFALPLCSGNSEIVIVGELESKGYVQMTLEILEAFGIEIHVVDENKYIIEGNQKYSPRNYTVEGDYSQAAFWIAAGTISGEVSLHGLSKHSKQGDMAVIDVIKSMGGSIDWHEDKLVIRPAQTKGVVIDAKDIPDIVPILSVVAALSEGHTEIINAGRLRIKESDRLLSTATELSKLGADIVVKNDGLIINGVTRFNGAEVSSWNDHRIAMALAIASSRSFEFIKIEGVDAVEKSYPEFWKDFIQCGGVLR